MSRKKTSLDYFSVFLTILCGVYWLGFYGRLPIFSQRRKSGFVLRLCNNIESAGSKIFLNHRVKTMLLNDKNKAIGVSLEEENSKNSR